MDYLINSLVLLGILALFLFGPRRRGYRVGPVERAGSVVLFVLAVLAFALSFLWWFFIGDRLPLQVG
jgi:hypothetical protein